MSPLEIQDAINKLPIDDDNKAYYEELLSLPYDVFRPLVFDLISGKISITDLIPTKQGIETDNALKVMATPSFDFPNEKSVLLKDSLLGITKGLPPSFQETTVSSSFKTKVSNQPPIELKTPDGTEPLPSYEESEVLINKTTFALTGDAKKKAADERESEKTKK
jgi:hypothetical protein